MLTLDTRLALDCLFIGYFRGMKFHLHPKLSLDLFTDHFQVNLANS